MPDLHPMRRLLALAAFVAIFSSPCVALAQSMSTPSTQKTLGDQRALEEVIVTATRREVNVQSVPLSVHVITGDDLTRMGATSFADYGRTVPGLSFTDVGNGGEKQTIRGISTDTWVDVNPTTAVYLGEVPVTNPGGTGAPYHPDPMLIDIARIEVLRGPQGTLFGSSAMGGAIRIITNEPNLSETQGFVGAMVSTMKDGGSGYEFHGMFNVPFSDGRAGIRAVGYHRDAAGYIDNVSNGEKDVNNNETSGIRMSGTVLLSDKVSLTGRIVYQERQSDGTDMEEPGDGPRKQSRIKEPNQDEWVNYNLVVNADLGWGSLTSSTSFLDRTIDTTGDVSAILELFFGINNPLWVINEDDINEFIQEVRIVSNDNNRVNWLAGVFYQDQDYDFNQDFSSPGFDELTGGLASTFGPPDKLFVTRNNFTLDQLALYGELLYPLTESLEFTAGLRWFKIDRDFSTENTGLLFRGTPLASGSARESGVTPKFSLSYVAGDNLTLYGTAAQGFRAGGINPPQAANEPGCALELEALGFAEFPISYDSDSLWSYELGSKARMLDGRLQLNTALYHIDWSDMQTSKLLNCGAGLIENAGAVDSDGIEFELIAHPLEGLDIILTTAFNRAELSEDVPNLGGSVGDRIPGVPRLTANVGFSYYFKVFSGYEAFISSDYQYVGDSYNAFDRSNSIKLPSFSLANFRIGLNTKHWSSALFINNAFDERGILFVNENILGTWVGATPPRTIGVSTTWRF
jgi:outer membrane receptor protein involved in Fe transport